MTMCSMALIVPYRDREKHLEEFVPYMHHFLSTIPYHIYLIEQSGEAPFNRGQLLNIGFQLSRGTSEYVCFHDVDMLPVSADYSKPLRPTHLARSVEQFNYGMPYPGYFGGVTLFPLHDFENVNGFSNGYWGWGLEDDDLKLRCKRKGIPLLTREGIFLSLPHQRAQETDILVHANRERFEEVLFGAEEMTEGLSTLQYRVIDRTDRGELSHFLVEIPTP